MSCDNNNSSAVAPGFPNSATMGTLSTNFPVVWEEISAIQQAILAAASQCQPGGGKMSTTVAGNTPMTFVSGVSSVSVISGGTGYYLDSPAVKFIPPAGSTAIGATGNVVTNGGNILGITITNGGTGYQPVHSTLSVTSAAGIGAILMPIINVNGNIVGVDIVNGGSGYTLTDEVAANRAVTPAGYVFDAIFSITAVSALGAIESITILNPGTGYQLSVAKAQIVSSLDPSLPYPLGTGFIADVLTDTNGSIVQVLIRNTGYGYMTMLPYLVISNAGTGAQTSVTLNGTSVESIAVNASGTGYSLPVSGAVFNPPTAVLPNPPSTPAVVDIKVSTNTYGTNPHLYWQVWAGAATDKAIQLQMNSVLSYFTSLGYTVQIQSNPLTGSTIQWYIGW